MASKICICVLVGIPGSGKTTFAQEIVTVPSFRKIIFSFDEFEFNEPNYKFYRKRVRDRLELLIKDEVDSNSSPCVIIVDDIMIYESMRYEIFLLSRKYELGYCVIFLRTDLELCISRNYQRNSAEVTEEMIRSHSSKLEPPIRNHKSINRFSMEILNNCYKTEEVLRLIEKALENPERRIEEKKNFPQSQSDVHKIDLMLRKYIGKCVSEGRDSAEKVKLAQDMNNRRQDLLSDIRSNRLEFEDPFSDVFNYL